MAKSAGTAVRGVLFVTLALLLALVPAAAQDCATLRDRLDRGESLRLGVQPSTRPFSFFEDGRGAGYMVDVCEAALERGAEMATLPAPRFEHVRVDGIGPQFDALGAGEVDLLCTPTTHTVQRRIDHDAAFSLTVFLTGAAFLYREEARVSDLSDLRGGTVTALENSTTLNGLGEAVSLRPASDGIRVEGVSSHGKGVARLAAGATLAHAGDQAILLPFLDEYPDLRLGDRLHSFEPYAIAIRRCDTAGLDLLDNGIARLFRSGAIWDSYARYFSGREPGALLIATYILGGLPE